MSRGRILVVDDEQGMREVLSDLLVSRGYEVTTAASGRAALALLDAVSPDVVRLDMMMPEMDGIETLRHIATARPAVPVVMVTANPDVENTSRVLREGAADYVPKPVDARYLDRVITVQVLGRQTAESSPVITLDGADCVEPAGVGVFSLEEPGGIS